MLAPAFLGLLVNDNQMVRLHGIEKLAPQDFVMDVAMCSASSGANDIPDIRLHPNFWYRFEFDAVR